MKTIDIINAQEARLKEALAIVNALNVYQWRRVASGSIPDEDVSPIDIHLCAYDVRVVWRSSYFDREDLDAIVRAAIVPRWWVKVERCDDRSVRAQFHAVIQEP